MEVKGIINCIPFIFFFSNLYAFPSPWEILNNGLLSVQLQWGMRLKTYRLFLWNKKVKQKHSVQQREKKHHNLGLAQRENERICWHFLLIYLYFRPNLDVAYETMGYYRVWLLDSCHFHCSLFSYFSKIRPIWSFPSIMNHTQTLSVTGVPLWLSLHVIWKRNLGSQSLLFSLLKCDHSSHTFSTLSLETAFGDRWPDGLLIISDFEGWMYWTLLRVLLSSVDAFLWIWISIMSNISLDHAMRNYKWIKLYFWHHVLHYGTMHN